MQKYTRIRVSTNQDGMWDFASPGVLRSALVSDGTRDPRSCMSPYRDVDHFTTFRAISRDPRLGSSVYTGSRTSCDARVTLGASRSASFDKKSEQFSLVLMLKKIQAFSCGRSDSCFTLDAPQEDATIL